MLHVFERKIHQHLPQLWSKTYSRRMALAPTCSVYRVDVETDRNSAAARHSWARQNTGLLLSFSLFPVQHPLCT